MTREGLLGVLEQSSFTFKDPLLLYVRTHKEISSLRELIAAYKAQLSDYYANKEENASKQQEILTTLTELQSLLDSWR